MSYSPNHPDLTTWLSIDAGTDFPVQNLPFGIFSTEHRSERPGVAIGQYILDLQLLGEANLLVLEAPYFELETLNTFFSYGRKEISRVRNQISRLLTGDSSKLKDHPDREDFFVLQAEATMHLPFAIGDYTDFYSSEDHARNVGTMFRDPENALLPNWKHIPVGYHGRASSIVVSGTPIHRPKGQTLPQDATSPVYGPSRLVDFELEMAFVTCGENILGEPISIDQAEEHIGGLMLFNDLSARDIQKWEYVPLGPFLAKNFGSILSPWVVTLDALEPFRLESPVQDDPKPLPYIQYNGKGHFDVKLEVAITEETGDTTTICQSNFKYMYWNMFQQLAHQTVNGCNVRTGDLYASGTISGPEPTSYGSMLELAWRGSKPIKLSSGNERKFLADGDTCTMRGYAEKDGVRIGFGPCSFTLLPARS